MKKVTMITMTALAVAAANASYAEEQLDTLVVTASGFEQDTTEAPATITVVTKEEIEKGSYRNISEVLESVPGIQLARATSGASGTNIQMRGLLPDYTMMLVDGRTQSSRESREKRADGYDQEWLPPLSMIERIEVIPGPMSTLYGSSAMGGVINIITKKHTEKWSGNLRSEAIFAEGSEFNDTKKNSVFLSGPILKDTLSLQLSAEYFDQEEDNIDGGNADKQIENYFGKLIYSANQSHDFALDISKSEQERTRTAGKSDDDDDLEENEKESVAITHFGKYKAVSETTFIQHDSTENITDESTITNTIFDTKWITPTDNHVIAFGGSYTKADLKDEGNQVENGTDTLSNDQLSIFIEDEWYLTDTFALTTGIRADKNENFENHLSPKVYGVWSVSDEWILKGGVSTGYKAPSLRRLSEDWAIASQGRDTYGNPDLKPESSVSSEINLTYSGSSFVASTTVFHTHFEDKLDTANCDNNCPVNTTTTTRRGRTTTVANRYWTNIDEVELNGAELNAKYLVTDALSTSLSYSYNDSKQLTGDNKGDPLSSIPLHLAVLSVNWTATDKLRLWTDYTYYGEANEEDDPTPSYKLIDVGANYTFNKNLKLSLGINNALNEEFTDEEYGYVDHGREYWAAVDVSF
ncbi:TonB-dependent receptor domain-containing protein [Marinomonas mediterranea]|uniref:TonB-dependent receptor domain-containing protein n=1 Tax=Marinomonas mediterranea TaxID=119864 RepID=UPI00234A32EA|nr:TonB-dependent receptor [Marinomonas mediterranea]WCN08223.1 TonB-dependent receptor [Marinomonas mediterranea]